MKALTIAVGIATYLRSEDLIECLKYLNCQTRIPDEIIIADASQNWQETKILLQKRFPTLFQKATLKYLNTEIGLTLQRNKIVDHLESDIIIFFDDDTRASPTYIEKIMQLYEGDMDGLIGGVDGMVLEGLSMHDFERWCWPGESTSESISKLSLLKSFSIHRFLTWLEIRLVGPMIPLNLLQPMPMKVPQTLRNLPIVSVRTLYGCNMSYRKEQINNNRFNTNFKRYAFLEDFDVSYRIGSNKLLLRRTDALVLHLSSKASRLDPTLVSYLYLINLAYIAKTTLPWSKEVAAHQIQHAYKRLWFEFVLGFFRKTGFGHYRAMKEASGEIIQILNAPQESVEDVYRKAQDKGFNKMKF